MHVLPSHLFVVPRQVAITNCSLLIDILFFVEECDNTIGQFMHIDTLDMF